MMQLKPITFRGAVAYVAKNHRHNKPPRGHKFSISVVDENGKIVGVAMVGRPVARAFDDGLTAEVNRTCTRGYPNANSKLYGAALRACKAMGYQRVITYTQKKETGASLRAVGFVRVKELAPRGSWKECSKKLAHIRDAKGTGNTARVLWEVRFGQCVIVKQQLEESSHTPRKRLSTFRKNRLPMATNGLRKV